jgi:Ca2+-binding RTX toxin-like protein
MRSSWLTQYQAALTLTLASNSEKQGVTEMVNIIKGTEFNDNGVDKPKLIGTDPVFQEAPPNNFPILIKAGVDEIYGYGGNDVLSGLGGDDVLYGASGEDRLFGGEGSDKLYGGTQKDLLYGGAGNDKLYGEAGDDRLYGEAGDDTLTGDSGKDYLNGFGSGGEYDFLTGGTEADTFVVGVGRNNSIQYLGSGYVTITDFKTVEGDKIELLDLVYTNNEYSLSTGQWEGSNALDTGIFYKGDLIGVVQDTTNVSFQKDFTFVPYVVG